jgi:hypothetical protein
VIENLQHETDQEADLQRRASGPASPRFGPGFTVTKEVIFRVRRDGHDPG